MIFNKYILLFFLCLVYLLFYSGHDPDRENFLKPSTNDHYNFIAINEVMMWVSNNGMGSHDPNNDGNGFYWPGGQHAQDAAIFTDGLVWGGVIDGEKRTNGNTHFIGLQAGKILQPGVADNPALPQYRVYKIKKDWENHPNEEERLLYERDYNEWPVEDGAPWVDVDGDGIFRRGIDQPKFIGDEVLWYVSNDLDSYRSRGTYGSDPIGLEFQTTVWGYNEKSFLSNVVFKKYTIINKSTLHIDSMYISYFTDNDMGVAHDDAACCDTLLNLGYVYNFDNMDGDGAGIQYGLNPPAVGHMFVQGPIVPGEPTDKAKIYNGWLQGYRNLNINSFFLYINPNTTYLNPASKVYKGTLQLYNNMQGRIWNGNPIIDPNTGLVTTFCVPGDPVKMEGWYEGAGWPGGEDFTNKAFLLTCGPLTMAPGDTQDVVVAIFMAQGKDHLDSVTELKKTARSVQIAYDQDFKTTPVMDKPEIKSAKDDKSITLYWDLNTENFSVTDPVIEVNDFDDKTYSFEGYRVWQFRDPEGSDPRVVATYDLRNDVTTVYDWQLINGQHAYVPAVNGSNTDVRRSHLIKRSIYDDQPLNNGNPYFFAVTAYAYSEHSYPKVIESKPQIIEVIPGLQRIDQTSIYENGDRLVADHISGDGDGEVELTIIDPTELTGDEYRLIYEEEPVNAYSFINYTKHDTIFSDCTDFSADTAGVIIMEGFILKIYDRFYELRSQPGNSAESSFIKNVLETAGPGGVDLETPIDVFENQNSTADWEITSYGNEPLIENIDMADGAGINNYEVRFTSGGSQYYLAGSAPSFSPWRGRDPLAADRVPFEVWDMGSTDSPDDDVRLTIKILDEFNRNEKDSLLVKTDSTWSQLDNGNWEPIYAFFDDSVYSEPLVDPSAVISPESRFKVGKIVIRGNLPEEGTIIQISTVKPLSFGDVFSVIATAPNTEDYAAAKTNLDDISVFPNPFFGTALYSGYNEQSFVRFTNLPTEVTLRIFSIGGTYVRRIDKNDDNPWLDWDLNNNAGETVASGVYIAHLEMPNIGEKVMKVAVILEDGQ